MRARAKSTLSVRKKKEANKGFVKLMALCKNGDHSGLVSMLSKGQRDLNKHDEQEWTPLIWAVFNGHLDVVKELVRNGAWVNVEDDQSRSPLYFSCGWGGDAGESGEICKFLISSNANINAVSNDDWSPLYLSAFRGRKSTASILLKAGADLFTTDVQGRSALDIAEARKQNEIYQMIIRQVEGLVRTHAKAGSIKQMKTLFEKNIPFDKNAQDEHGNTFLHIAMNAGKEQVVKFLVDNGVDIYVKNKAGKEAKTLAAENGNLSLLKLFQKFVETSNDKNEEYIRSPSPEKRPTSARSVTDVSKHPKSISQSSDVVSFKAAERGKPVNNMMFNEINFLSNLSVEEKFHAVNNLHLRGLVQQACNYASSEDTVSFSNLAYGSYLAHLEGIIRAGTRIKWSDPESEVSDSLLRKLDIRSSEKREKWANLYKEGEKIPSELLVDEYLVFACDEELDDIVVDPSLVKQYVKLMGKDRKAEELPDLSHFSALMDQLKGETQTESPIILRRTKSSALLQRRKKSLPAQRARSPKKNKVRAHQSVKIK